MDDGPEDDEENSPPNPDSCAVSPHNFGSLHESGRFEVLDRALDSLENSARVSTVVPTFECVDSQRMATLWGTPRAAGPCGTFPLARRPFDEFCRFDATFLRRYDRQSAREEVVA